MSDLTSVLLDALHREAVAGLDITFDDIGELAPRLASLFEEWSEDHDDDQDSPTYDTYVKMYRLKVQ